MRDDRVMPRRVETTLENTDLVALLAEVRDEVKAYRDHAELVGARRVVSIDIAVDPPRATIAWWSTIKPVGPDSAGW